MKSFIEFAKSDSSINENLARKADDIIKIARLVVEKEKDNYDDVNFALKPFSMALSNAVIASVLNELTEL